MFSDRSAKDIIAVHKHDKEKMPESGLPQKPATQFSTGIKMVLIIYLIKKD